MAGALGVELGGAATYEGVMHERPLFGDRPPPAERRPRPGTADLPRSLRVALVRCALALAVGAALWPR